MHIELAGHRRHVFSDHVDACPVTLDFAVVDVAHSFSENPESVRAFKIRVIQEHITGSILHVGIGIDEGGVLVVGVIDETAATDIDSDAAMQEKPVLERCTSTVHIDAIHGDVVHCP
jgi:hypothetical protein